MKVKTTFIAKNSEAVLFLIIYMGADTVFLHVMLGRLESPYVQL